MNPTELKPGMMIDYRGQQALVGFECWTRIEDARGGFDAPVGCVIEWIDERNQVQRCRLLWPALDPDVRAEFKARPQSAYDRALEASMVASNAANEAAQQQYDEALAAYQAAVDAGDTNAAEPTKPVLATFAARKAAALIAAQAAFDAAVAKVAAEKEDLFQQSLIDSPVTLWR